MLAALSAAADRSLREQAGSLFGAIEAVERQTISAPEVRLGRALFWDTRLSADGKTACASCHLREDWGADRRKRSPDARGKLTKRHAQTVLNTQRATAGLRWLADRATGADQALGSITGSMGFERREALVAALLDLGYAGAFAAAYPEDPDPVSAEHYALALQAYQETLLTPAPFDAWLGGDDTALDAREQRGLQRFIETGCGGCHSGPLFGGGHVVLPLLQAEVVPPGWVSNEAFLAGYGAAQAVPGPLFTFAAYLGTVMNAAPNGWLGALLCLVAIFIPSFLLVIGVLPFWNYLREVEVLRRALVGVNAAVVGLLLAAFYDPMWTSGVRAPADFVLALGAFVLLVFWRAPPWLVVVLTAAAGWAVAEVSIT